MAILELNVVTPATPIAGRTMVYVDTVTKRLTTIDDAGVVTNYTPVSYDGILAEEVTPAIPPAWFVHFYADSVTKKRASIDDAWSVTLYDPPIRTSWHTTNITRIGTFGGASVTPNIDNDDMMYSDPAFPISQAFTFNVPTGTLTNYPTELTIRIQDNWNPRGLTFTGGVGWYRASAALPFPAALAGAWLWMYMKFLWNNADSRWDLVALQDWF